MTMKHGLLHQMKRQNFGGKPYSKAATWKTKNIKMQIRELGYEDKTWKNSCKIESNDWIWYYTRT